MEEDAQNSEARIAEVVREAVQKAFSLSPRSYAPGGQPTPETLFQSRRAAALKQEIILTGRKLWQRSYVDGNGGNLSARLTDDLILCTPTLVSKGDLTPEDIGLVDLNNALVCGDRPQTSEILLHLEIYKAIPQARAVVHCHPPYATAHAIAGVTPPQHLLPEQEVFVGPIAISPYHTPGTAEFARSILPYVHQHRVILLANHGLVSWADTPTHAEWAVEILETYCQTAHLARQLNPNFNAIPPAEITKLLDVKRQLGIPDPRFTEQPTPAAEDRNPPGPIPVEELVQSLTRQILAYAAAHLNSEPGVRR